MEKCYECSYNTNAIYCKDCEYGLCQDCNKQKHFELVKKDQAKDSDNFTHDFYLICDECEKLPRDKYCELCEQYLCVDCDKKIHKKGTRTLHKRNTIEQKNEKYKIILNFIVFSTKESVVNQNNYEETNENSPNDLIQTNINKLQRFLQYFENTNNYNKQLGYSIVLYDKSNKSISDILEQYPMIGKMQFTEEGSIENCLVILLEKFSSECFLNYQIIFNNNSKNLNDRYYQDTAKLRNRYNYCQILINEVPDFIPKNDLNISLSKNDNGDDSRLNMKDKFQLLGSTTTKNNSKSYIKLDQVKINIAKQPIIEVTNSTNSNSKIMFNNTNQELKDQNSSSIFTNNYFDLNKNYTNNTNETSYTMQNSTDVLVSNNPLKEMIPQQNPNQSNSYNLETLNMASKLSHHLNKNVLNRNSKKVIDINTDLNSCTYTSLNLDKKANDKQNTYRKLSDTPYNSLTFFHAFNDINRDSVITPSISYKIQMGLKTLAEDGQLMVDYSFFLKKMVEILETNDLYAQNILLKAADLNIINISNRQMTQKHSLNFVGLKIVILSCENIYWALKSQVLDRITLTETVQQHRIKESIGFKVTNKSWKEIINQFTAYIEEVKSNININSPSLMNNSSSNNLPRQNKELDMLSGIMVYKNVNDPLSNEKTTIFQLKGFEEYEPEDFGYIDENSEEWKVYLKYIDDLFDDNLTFFNDFNNDKSQNYNKKKKHCNPNEVPIYKKRNEMSNDSENQTVKFDENLNLDLNGVNMPDDNEFSKNNYQNENSSINACNKNSFIGSQSSKIDIETNLKKSIPGGRFGFSQFIKFFGPEPLKQKSVGFLTRIIQKSIDNGILKYVKTFLVKVEDNKNLESESIIAEHINTSNNENSFVQHNLKNIELKLTEYLLENDNILPLAQVKGLQCKKIDPNFNQENYGFTKLKSLLDRLSEKQIIETIGDDTKIIKLKEEIYEMSNNHKNKEKIKRKSQIPEEYGPILGNLDITNNESQKSKHTKNSKISKRKKSNRSKIYDNISNEDSGRQHININKVIGVNPPPGLSNLALENNVMNKTLKQKLTVDLLKVQADLSKKKNKAKTQIPGLKNNVYVPNSSTLDIGQNNPNKMVHFVNNSMIDFPSKMPNAQTTNTNLTLENVVGSQHFGQPKNNLSNNETLEYQKLKNDQINKHRRTSSIDNYINNMSASICDILRENQQGVDINVQHFKLSEKLKKQSFNPKNFGYKNFYSFLMELYGQQILIENRVSPDTGLTSMTVYLNYTYCNKMQAQKNQHLLGNNILKPNVNQYQNLLSMNTPRKEHFTENILASLPNLNDSNRKELQINNQNISNFIEGLPSVVLGKDLSKLNLSANPTLDLNDTLIEKHHHNLTNESWYYDWHEYTDLLNGRKAGEKEINTNLTHEGYLQEKNKFVGSVDGNRTNKTFFYTDKCDISSITRNVDVSHLVSYQQFSEHHSKVFSMTEQLKLQTVNEKETEKSDVTENVEKNDGINNSPERKGILYGPENRMYFESQNKKSGNSNLCHETYTRKNTSIIEKENSKLNNNQEGSEHESSSKNSKASDQKLDFEKANYIKESNELKDNQNDNQLDNNSIKQSNQEQNNNLDKSLKYHKSSTIPGNYESPCNENKQNSSEKNIQKKYQTN